MPLLYHAFSHSTQGDEVIFTEFGRKGLVTLNREKRLNALNDEMVSKIYNKLKQWDRSKDLILIKGSGKAFCSGGDLVVTYNDKTGELSKAHCRSEYLTNAMIASLKVPYVSIIHGIVMGGGVGLSIHGKYRVATETSLFAMPEVLIGLYPDVGVTHYLSRMPKRLGILLALTGYRLKGFDLYHCGIATHFCHSSLLPELEEKLLQPHTEVDAVLNEFHTASVDALPGGQPPHFSLSQHVETIEFCFSAPTVEEIIKRLQNLNTDFTCDLLKAISSASPVAVKVTQHRLKMAKDQDIYEALNTDLRVTWRMCEGVDLYEGVRAQVIDKDKSPKWQHDSIEEVTDEEVLKYFKKLDGSQELNLPASLSL